MDITYHKAAYVQVTVAQFEDIGFIDYWADGEENICASSEQVSIAIEDKHTTPETLDFLKDVLISIGKAEGAVSDIVFHK